jgi:hypothetical protein
MDFNQPNMKKSKLCSTWNLGLGFQSFKHLKIRTLTLFGNLKYKITTSFHILLQFICKICEKQVYVINWYINLSTNNHSIIMLKDILKPVD